MHETGKGQMTSRERIRATVKGLPIDRVPLFIWIEAHTGCRMMAEFKPSRNWSWNFFARFFWNRFQGGGAANAGQLWRMAPLFFDVHSFNLANAYSFEVGSDLALFSHSTPWKYFKMYLEKGQFRFLDLYGVVRGLGTGIYPDAIGPAVKSLEDMKNYQFPDPREEKRYDIFRKYRKAYPDKSIASEVWGTQDFTATSVLGMERFMTFLVDYPEEMKNFMARWADFHIEVIRRSVAAGADIVMIEDDYGYDNRPLMSPKMWKEFTYPGLKRLIDAAHDAGALAMLHSCGYQMPFLEHYVAAGLDILHPFQPKAGNDFKSAYAKYGSRITFATGIDIQLGEMMTPEQLKQDILKNYQLAGKQGHHILSTTHEIQYTMPEQNLAAIFDTIRGIGAG